MSRESVDVSVVCPFFNEEGILEHAISTMLERLRTREDRWELVVVNDGSVDGSEAIALRLAAQEPRLRVLGYPQNRGRGHALRTGIKAARGAIIVTTEIDLSWGDTIIDDLVAAMRRWPDADAIVASPHLPGGGYRNVPGHRVFLSRAGNIIIRALMSNAVSMNTGMTRAYRRDLIQSLPLMEDGKEFHLEVILKATACGARLREIPAMLEWKAYKHAGKRVQRISSTRIRRLIVSHSMFSLFAHPVRYVLAASIFSIAVGGIALAWAIALLTRGGVSVYMAQMSVLMVILGIVLFVMSVVLQQGWMIQRELWEMRRAMARRDDASPGGPAA